MSDGTGENKGRTNRQINKQDHRERVRQAQLKQKQAERRKKQFVVGGVVLAVIAVAAVTGIIVANNKPKSTFGDKMPFAAPTGVSANPATVADPGGIVYGKADAKVTLQIWEDTRCPYCKIAETTLGDIVTQYADAGKIKVEFHQVNLIDRMSGGQGSIVGGNALGCAQDVGTARFIAFHKIVYANQPDESNDSYGDPANLIKLADQVPELSTAAFKACANDGKYAKWVTANYDALGKKLGGAGVGTPDYYIDDVKFSMTAADAAALQTSFKAALDAAIAKKG